MDFKSSSTFCWEWEGSGRWTPYKAQVQYQIEEAYQHNNKGHVIIDIDGHSYKIDFTTGKQYRVDTAHRTRNIKRTQIQIQKNDNNNINNNNTKKANESNLPTNDVTNVTNEQQDDAIVKNVKENQNVDVEDMTKAMKDLVMLTCSLATRLPALFGSQFIFDKEAFQKIETMSNFGVNNATEVALSLCKNVEDLNRNIDVFSHLHFNKQQQQQQQQQQMVTPPQVMQQQQQQQQIVTPPQVMQQQQGPPFAQMTPPISFDHQFVLPPLQTALPPLVEVKSSSGYQLHPQTHVHINSQEPLHANSLAPFYATPQPIQSLFTQPQQQQHLLSSQQQHLLSPQQQQYLMAQQYLTQPFPYYPVKVR